MKSLTNHHDEPPERRWLGEHEAWKEQDWSLAMISFEHLENEKMKLLEEITEKTWNSGREKINTWNENSFIMINLRKKELHHLDETRIRIYVCLSFINLTWWKSMDLGILLILNLEKIEERYSAILGKVLMNLNHR